MPTNESEREYGPTWGDVNRAQGWFQITHDRVVKIDCTFPTDRSGAHRIYWRVRALTRTGDYGARGELAEGHYWPASDWKTVPAMLLALLHRLDWAMTEREKQAERQASF